MRIKQILAFIFFMSACSSIDTGRIAPGYTEAFHSIKSLVFESKSNIPIEVIENIPYASALIRIGKGPEGLMILESKNKGVESWITADGINILIKNGRIIGTFGLENNLTSLVYPSISNFSTGLNTYNFYYSYDEPFLNNLKVEVNTVSKGKEIVYMKTNNRDLLLVEESFISKKIRWKGKNKFWKDEDGHVWKSEQYISPKLPLFQIEVTKKPSF